MDSPKIFCPTCNAEISIDEVLRKQSEDKIRKDIQQQERLKFDEEKKEAIKKQQEEDFQKNKLTQDRLKEVEEQNKKIQLDNLVNLKEKHKLEDQLKERDLAEAKRIREETKKAREEGMAAANDQNRLKQAEDQQEKLQLKKKVDELQQKLEQGSQQTQGEVLELELEELLKREFPNDDIKPVPKGMRGADVIQIIYGASGNTIGKIIWESKRAKEFGKDWIRTLKTNSIEAGADVAILVTTIMPEEIQYFGPKGGVYVSSISCIKEVARLIRGTLLKVYKVKEENTDKKDIVWSYLTSSQFAQKFAVVVENYIADKEDLEREKRIAIKNWSAREKRMERTVNTLAMIYGDLQGLMGASLPEIASLEITTTETLEQFDSKQIYTKQTSVIAENLDSISSDELPT